jgi:hypothetical protein
MPKGNLKRLQLRIVEKAIRSRAKFIDIFLLNAGFEVLNSLAELYYKFSACTHYIKYPSSYHFWPQYNLESRANADLTRWTKALNGRQGLVGVTGTYSSLRLSRLVIMPRLRLHPLNIIAAVLKTLVLNALCIAGLCSSLYCS